MQMRVASDKVYVTPRVQEGLELIRERRFQREAPWAEKLTVVDEATVKFPLVKRKALANNKILSEVPLEIRKHELIVGSGIPGARGFGQGCFPEYATQEEIKAAAKDFVGPKSVFGHCSPYYPRYLNLGVGGLRKLAEDKLGEIRRRGSEPEKEAWYESVIISIEGFRNFIRRYRDLASDFSQSETNLMRKGELKAIVRITENLLTEAPKTFREAIQAIWFAHISFRNTMSYLPLGRFDQYLWPYLKRDLADDAITNDEAQELVDCFWLKCNDQLQAFELQEGVTISAMERPLSTTDLADRIGYRGLYLGGKTTVDRLTTGGYADGGSAGQFLQTATLSGLMPEGRDGTNPLTYLCLNAHYRLKTPQPCLYVRFHQGSPPELYERVSNCIRTGCIGPTIYNDEVIVPALIKLGIPPEHARDYTSDGCWEPHIQGRTDFKHGWISAAEALDRLLSPARWEEVQVPLYIESLDPFAGSTTPDPYKFSSFDEVMDLVKENIDKNVGGFIRVAQTMRDGRLYKILPFPFLSAFMEGPLESGRDLTQGGAEYTFHMPELAGLSHAADSLAVIKKLCFEGETIKWPELLDAVRSNWQGNEYLRQLVRTRVAAYGNDVDYVDDIATEIVDFFAKSVRKHSAGVPSNVKYTAGLATYEVYAVLGTLVGATPDGRLEGEPLSTNASPSIGRAVSGQTAAMNSFTKLPLVDLPGGACLELNISARTNLLSQLEPFIKSFVEKRGSLVNIAVNDCEKLRAARAEPEKYRDLKVRVAGYEAYFVDLPPSHQELQIQRCEQYAK